MAKTLRTRFTKKPKILPSTLHTHIYFIMAHGLAFFIQTIKKRWMAEGKKAAKH
jgi:hypothetical protein